MYIKLPLEGTCTIIGNSLGTRLNKQMIAITRYDKIVGTIQSKAKPINNWPIGALCCPLHIGVSCGEAGTNSCHEREGLVSQKKKKKNKGVVT